MECPASKSPLLSLEYKEIELDYCPECYGKWLDAGELELLLGDSVLVEGFLEGGEPRHTKEKKTALSPLPQSHAQGTKPWAGAGGL